MPRTNRRQHVHTLAWGLLTASGTTSVVAMGALLFPRTRYRPPSQVWVGRPEDYRVGEVSERFRQSHRIVVVRNASGFYALSAVCTHLGCIARWQPAQDKLKCFCHGSGFRRTGENFEGPAPRPLERLDIGLDRAGRIVVDTDIRYRAERGEWDSEGALLAYRGERRD